MQPDLVERDERPLMRNLSEEPAHCHGWNACESCAFTDTRLTANGALAYRHVLCSLSSTQYRIYFLTLIPTLILPF